MYSHVRMPFARFWMTRFQICSRMMSMPKERSDWPSWEMS